MLLPFVAITLIAGLMAYLLLAQGVARRRRGKPSTALALSDQTAIDRSIAPLAADHPGETGIAFLARNLDAFHARFASARAAGRSLDLQYYYWETDITGRILCRELIRAADRGVRVRLLLDDMNSFGLEATYVALDSHPNIEVRLFNPSRSRGNPVRRGLELMVKYFTATRRMHNKCWIADGRIAIAGGRNIGDAYFDASAAANFRDVDALLAGAAVAEAEAVFDAYWNSQPSLPIKSLHPIRRPKLARLARRLDARCEEGPARDYLALVEDNAPADGPFLADLRYHWSANVEVLADPPEKAAGLGQERWLGRRVEALFRSAAADLRITSPYFIPGPAGTRALADIAAKGARVAVLTNSLAATDVLAVHGAYARYRVPLVGTGVKLFELKPEDRQTRASLFGSSTASLHTKAFVIDGLVGFVGSFNLDPRSVSINTEMGVLFRQRELAEELRRLFDLQTSPRSSYAVVLADGRIGWADDEDPSGLSRRREPGAKLLRIAAARLIGLLPIESQL